MEMRDDEIGTVPMDVERGGGERDAGHFAEDEEIEKAADIGKRRGEDDGAAVHGADPVEDLDGGEDAHQHGEDAEGAGVESALARDEEVVAPGEEADEAAADGAPRDRLVTEWVLPRE